MNITQVKVFPVQEEKLKAFVSIVFDHCFMVNDIKVIQGKDGLFLSMPSRRKRSGEFKDVAHPLNHETRREIELKVLEEYRHVVDDETPRRPDRVETGDDNGQVAQPAAQPAAAQPVAQPAAAQPSVARPAVARTRPETNAEVAPVPRPGEHASRNGSDPARHPDVRRDEEPAPAVAASADGGETVDDDSVGPDEAKTLEEVQEEHLSDSFWSVG